MSCLNCGLLLIIIISVFVPEINLANGKFPDDKYRRGLDEVRRYLTPRYPLRHNPYYNGRKHKYHGYDFSYWKWKKPERRFTALDKVDDRLNNAAYDLFDKSLKMTTTHSSDIWEDEIVSNSTLYIKQKSDSDNITANHIDKKKHETVLAWDKSDYDLDFIGDGKGFIHDFTTTKPFSENPRQETTYHYRTNYVDKTWTTTEVPEEARNKATPKPLLSGVDAVFKHLTHMKREGRCRLPKPKVILVQDIHPDPSKTYIPSCTILHRCGPDTGCCEDVKDVCKPKNITKLELYFFTSGIDETQKEVEKLQFENHTECECRPRSEEVMPRDSPPHPDTGNYIKKDKCVCPFHYSPRYFHRSGSCICDCFDKQSDCLAQKKGKALFSAADQLCIRRKMCYYPSCEFGVYISSHGRCPRRSEKHFKYKRFISRSRIT